MSLLLSLALVAAAGASDRAQATRAFESLNQPLTASQTALGGLSPIGTGGPEMLRANPAGLVDSETPELRLSHRSWQKGLQQEWTGVALPVGRFVLAAEVAATHAGELSAFDAEGRELGSFRPVELIVGAGGAVEIGGRLSAGATIHFLRLDAPGGALQGLATDVGLAGRFGRTRVGLCLRNLGPDVDGDIGSYRLPRSVMLGIEQAVTSRTSLSLVGREEPDGTARFQASGRWSPQNGIALLAGTSYEPARVSSSFAPSLGADFAVGRVSVSYGFTAEGDLGSVHHVSVGLRPWRGAATLKSDGNPEIDRPSTTNERTTRTPPIAVESAAWSVWIGTHRSREAAAVEIRALRLEGFGDATIVEGKGETFRIRVATNLAESDAQALARRIRGTSARD